MATTAHHLRPPPLPASRPRLSSLPFLTRPLALLSTSSPLTHLSLRPNTKHLTTIKAVTSSSSSTPFETLFKPPSLIPLPSLDLSRITPITICKWSGILSVTLFAAKRTFATVSNPFFWLYFSWTWLFWPWVFAISLAVYAVYCFWKHSNGQSTVFEQLAIVTSAITWLTLVPPAHFNGFLEGWPIAMFFVYHYFFFFESTVRRRLYGDLYPRPHDSKWDIKIPAAFRFGFAALVFVGHWLAAHEGPELQRVPGGWANLGIWVLIATTLFMRYHSILYLSKYSENVAVPTAVVQFGPYRYVRHPIYSSVMLLFAVHCIALRAPLSLAFLVVVCLVYYGQKVEMEETLMLENFGERYREYMNKVKFKLIPFMY